MAKFKRQSKAEVLAKVGVAGLAALANVAKTYTKARVRKYASGPPPLTGQFDFKTDYAKRRKTLKQKKRSRKRRRWARSVVKAVRTANVGTVHLIKNSKATVTTDDGSSDAVSYGLYGLNGVAGDTFNTCNDVGEFIKEKDATAWNNYNSTSSSNYYQQSKLWVNHATMEMTIRNTHATNDAIVEAYYIRGRRPLESAWLSPTDCYARGIMRQIRAEDPDTGGLYDQALHFKQIGVTPFQSQIFCRHFNIYKRQKFRIPPGNEVSFVIYSRRPHAFATSDTYNFATDRRYHGVLFQQQGSPDGSTTAQPTSVTYLSVRRYRAKFIPANFVMGAMEVTDP